MWTNNTIDDLVLGVMRHGPDVLSQCTSNDVEVLKYIEFVQNEHFDYPVPKNDIDINNWFIPVEYKNLDVEKLLIDLCPKENLDRLTLELSLYRKHNMIDLLRTMKYVIDTLRKNNIVWGVGRGSSVASYALFLLGAHKIDSVKYSLPIDEFFKGETNG